MSPHASKQDVIEDLQNVADKIGEPPSGRQYNEHGEFSKSTIYSKFDTIQQAREAAGLGDEDLRGRKQTLTREELIEAIQSLQDELGRAPKRDEMLDRGNYSEGPFRREFGSWGEAVRAAGYEPYRPNTNLADYVDVTCAWCETSERVLASQTSNQSNWFCSKPCKHEWQAENVVGESHHQYDRVTAECAQCGSEKEVIPAVAKDGEHIFCDKECYADWCSEERVGEAHPRYTGGDAILQCEICGDDYSRRQAEVENSRFCSPECLGEARREEMVGENNPNYVHGKTDYYGHNWQKQRKKRLERDDYACVICGTTQEEHNQEFSADLSIHHIIPRREFITNGELDADAANRLSNLRTMCRVHHQEWEGVPIAPENVS